MCGFVAIISKAGSGQIGFKALRNMTDVIRHRGPDDEGFVVLNNDFQTIINNREQPVENTTYNYKIILGFRRLSIIDLSSAGHQPMNYQNRYWIVFNGEIYNFNLLKEELIKKGYIFNSKSDTEVIMAAYDCWGQDCFKRFNGMWAFVLFDRKLNQLIISRDRLGIKPLYYYEDKEKFIFASEIKSIIAYPQMSPNINRAEYCRFLASGEDVSLEDTMFNNIKRFKKASFAIIDFNKKDFGISYDIFWSPMINKIQEEFNDKKINDYAEQYCSILEDSVKLRLIADVKTGAALSGGLDSSSIVYNIVKNLKDDKKRFMTFSNVYSEDRFKSLDETYYINKLTSFFNVDTHKTTPKNEEIIEEFQKMIYIVGSPTNSSNMSGWYTYKLTRECGVTVTLDGQGADELAAGYTSYLFSHLINTKWRNLISEQKKVKNNFPNQNPSLIKAILAKSMKSVNPSIGQKLLSGLGLNINLTKSLNEVLWRDTDVNLANLLHYGDALSMAHSVESRLPFLDYRLVELLFKIAGCYKIHDGWTKYICRRSMNNKIPDEIVWRKDKLGWPNLDEFWFWELNKDWSIHMIKNSTLLNEFLGSNKISNFIKEDNLNNKMRMLSLAAWENIYKIS